MIHQLRRLANPATRADVEAAIAYTHDRYLDTLRVTVESAVDGQDRVRFAQCAWFSHRRDELLEVWLELDRQYRAKHLVCDWVKSYPGSLPPAWPEDAPS